MTFFSSVVVRTFDLQISMQCKNTEAIFKAPNVQLLWSSPGLHDAVDHVTIHQLTQRNILEEPEFSVGSLTENDDDDKVTSVSKRWGRQ
jgi:hypothetical protein